jgi:hypothetical protein
MGEKAFAEQDSNRLRALVAKFEKAIQDYDARLSASTVALAAFSHSSITAYSTSDTLAPALRHEDTAALPLFGTACEAPALRHAPAVPLAAPSEEVPLFHDTLPRNAPASRNEHTEALPHYVGTDRLSTQKRGCPRPPARKHCRHRSTLMPRFLWGRLLSPEPQLPLPASIGCFETTSSIKEEFSWSEETRGLKQSRPNSLVTVSEKSTQQLRKQLNPTCTCASFGKLFERMIKTFLC